MIIMDLYNNAEKSFISEDDSDLLKYKWYLRFQPGRKNLYVERKYAKNGKSTRVHLHRVILERKLDRVLLETEYVDHVNGNTLDNTRSNLRVASLHQNLMNRPVRSDSSTGVKCVFKRKNGKFYSKITYNKKPLLLGTFDNIEDASKAYNKKAVELFGNFAQLSIYDK